MNVETVENLIKSWAQTFGTDTKKSHNKSCGYLWGSIRKAGTGPGSLKEKVHLILPGFLKELEKLPPCHVCRQPSTTRAVLSGVGSLLGSLDISRACWRATAGLLWEATSVPSALAGSPNWKHHSEGTNSFFATENCIHLPRDRTLVWQVWPTSVLGSHGLCLHHHRVCCSSQHSVFTRELWAMCRGVRNSTSQLDIVRGQYTSLWKWDIEY